MRIHDRSSESMLAHLDQIAAYPDDRLNKLYDEAAREFAVNTLWRDVPADRQGAWDQRAWAIRDQRAESAKAVWLAVTAEQERRRCLSSSGRGL